MSADLLALIDAALATVEDPEIHRPITDLGMVKSRSVADGALPMQARALGIRMQDATFTRTANASIAGVETTVSSLAASDDQTRPGPSGDETSAACGIARGTGSNSENNIRPARNPPICACQATLAPSVPIEIDPMPKMMLTPNHTARKPSTRGLRSARDNDNAGTLAAGSAIADPKVTTGKTYIIPVRFEVKE